MKKFPNQVSCFNRLIAAAVSLSLLSTQVLFAHVAQTSVWDERRIGVKLQAMSQSLPIPFVPLPNFHAGANGKRVVIIRDVHLNGEAQENIVRMLRQMTDSQKVDLVAVEGAFGPFDFKRFREAADSKTVKDVADAYLKQNRIGAPSYVGMTGPDSLPAFIGVDDETHYEANLKAYLDSRHEKPAVRRVLELEKKDLKKKKAELFNPELRRFDASVDSYQRGATGLGKFLSDFTRFQSLTATPNLRQFLEAYRLEQTIDFARADAERRQVLEKIVLKIPKPAVDELMQMSVAYREGNVRYSDYYRYFSGLLNRYSIPLVQAPVFASYMRYIALSDGIDADHLLQETAEATRSVLARLARTDGERLLIQASRAHDLREKLVEFALTPSEWEEYSTSAPQAGLESFENFYAEAHARSEKIVANLTRAMGNAKRVSVLVVGGFHSPEITRLLKSKGTGVSVMSPHITKFDSGEGSAYLSIFSREKTPLEKIFQGEKLTMYPAPINGGAKNHFTAPVNGELYRVAQLAGRLRSGAVSPLGIATAVGNGVTYQMIEADRKMPAGFHAVPGATQQIGDLKMQCVESNLATTVLSTTIDRFIVGPLLRHLHFPWAMAILMASESGFKPVHQAGEWVPGYEDSLNHLRMKLPRLSAMGFNAVYICGLFEMGPKFTYDIHQVSHTGPHLLSYVDGKGRRIWTRVENYDVKNDRRQLLGKPFHFKNNYGMVFAIQPGPRINPQLGRDGTEEVALREFDELVEDAHALGIKVIVDFPPWAATDASFMPLVAGEEADDETAMKRVFGRLAPESDQQAWRQVRTDRDGTNRFIHDNFLPRFPAFSAAEDRSGRLWLIPNVMGGNKDEVPYDLLRPDVYGYFQQFFLWVMKHKVDGIRIDLVFELFVSELRKYASPERQHDYNRFMGEEPIIALLRWAKATAREEFKQPFYVFGELYDDWHRSRFNASLDKNNLAAANTAYYADPFKKYMAYIAALASGVDILQERGLEYLYRAVRHAWEESGNVIIFPGNFDEAPLAAIGGATYTFLDLLFLAAKGGVPLMIYERELRGFRGGAMEVSGKDHPTLSVEELRYWLSLGLSSDVLAAFETGTPTIDELGRILFFGLGMGQHKLLEIAPIGERMKTFLSVFTGHFSIPPKEVGESDSRIAEGDQHWMPDNSNRTRYMAFMGRYESQWYVYFGDFKWWEPLSREGRWVALSRQFLEACAARDENLKCLLTSSRFEREETPEEKRAVAALNQTYELSHPETGQTVAGPVFSLVINKENGARYPRLHVPVPDRGSRTNVFLVKSKVPDKAIPKLEVNLPPVIINGDGGTWLQQNVPNLDGKKIVEVTMEIAPSAAMLKAFEEEGLTDEQMRAVAMALSAGGIGPLLKERIIAQADLGADVMGISLLYDSVWVQKRHHDPVDGDSVRLEKVEVGKYFRKILDDQGTMEVKMADGSTAVARVWKAPAGMFGKGTVYFLEDIPAHNSSKITDVMYPGSADAPGMKEPLRLAQSWLLGRGTLTLLEKLNQAPDILVMSEMPTVFAFPRLIKDRFANHPLFKKTLTVFNDHTPLEYAHPRWDSGNLERIHIDPRYYWNLPIWDSHENKVDGTAMVINAADGVFGVAEKHARVMRAMPLLSQFGDKIDRVTNGVSRSYWPADASGKKERRHQLVHWLAKRTGLGTEWAKAIIKNNNPIGVWTRRIVQYKRLDLFAATVENAHMREDFLKTGIVFIMGGRIHQDNGWGTIQFNRILKTLSRDPRLKERVIILEDYNIWEAPLLFQGADFSVMLADDGQEASATGFQKAQMNGDLIIASNDGAIPESVKFFDGANLAVANGFMVPYMWQQDPNTENGEVKWIQGPTAEGLLNGFKAFRQIYDDEDAYATMMRNALMQTERVSVERTAKDMLIFLQGVLDKKEKKERSFNDGKKQGTLLLVQAGLSRAALIAIGEKLAHAPRFSWNYEAHATEKRELSSGGQGLREFLKSYHYIMTLGSAGEWGEKYHSSRRGGYGDIIGYLDWVFGAIPELKSIADQMRTLGMQAQKEPLERKLAINRAAIGIAEGVLERLEAGIASHDFPVDDSLLSQIASSLWIPGLLILTALLLDDWASSFVPLMGMLFMKFAVLSEHEIQLSQQIRSFRKVGNDSALADLVPVQSLDLASYTPEQQHLRTFGNANPANPANIFIRNSASEIRRNLRADKLNALLERRDCVVLVPKSQTQTELIQEILSVVHMAGGYSRPLVVAINKSNESVLTEETRAYFNLLRVQFVFESDLASVEAVEEGIFRPLKAKGYSFKVLVHADQLTPTSWERLLLEVGKKAGYEKIIHFVLMNSVKAQELMVQATVEDMNALMVFLSQA